MSDTEPTAEDVRAARLKEDRLDRLSEELDYVFGQLNETPAYAQDNHLWEAVSGLGRCVDLLRKLHTHEPRDRSERSVLIVEDDPAIGRALQRAIAYQYGYIVLLAPTVERATALLRSRHFSGVVSDYQLPDGTGADVLERCRVLSDAPSFVFLTGSTERAKVHGYPVLEKGSVGVDEVLRALGLT